MRSYRSLFVFSFLLFLFIEIVGGAVTVEQNSRMERTIARWVFQGSGNTVNDLTVNNNDGIIEGATWSRDSINGICDNSNCNCEEREEENHLIIECRCDGNIQILCPLSDSLEFDGIDDRVVIVKTPSVDLVNSVVLEASIKRKSDADGTIIAKNGPYYLGIRNNKVTGGVYTNDGNCPGQCVTPGLNTWTHVGGRTILEVDKWYRLKMVYDGQSVSVMVGSEPNIDMLSLENSVPKTGQMPIVSQQVFIGWGEPGLDQYFHGVIDEIWIRTIEKKFIRGDVNRDSNIDISDAVSILLHLFRGLELSCIDAADVNDDSRVNISDSQYLFNYLFKGGNRPPEPHQTPGIDWTSDQLTCDF